MIWFLCDIFIFVTSALGVQAGSQRPRLVPLSISSSIRVQQLPVDQVPVVVLAWCQFLHLKDLFCQLEGSSLDEIFYQWKSVPNLTSMLSQNLFEDGRNKKKLMLDDGQGKINFQRGYLLYIELEILYVTS
jgi:hypothetical protein